MNGEQEACTDAPPKYPKMESGWNLEASVPLVRIHQVKRNTHYGHNVTLEHLNHLQDLLLYFNRNWLGWGGYDREDSAARSCVTHFRTIRSLLSLTTQNHTRALFIQFAWFCVDISSALINSSRISLPKHRLLLNFIK